MTLFFLKEIMKSLFLARGFSIDASRRTRVKLKQI